MSDVDTSAEAVELFILIQISDIASSVGLPVTEDDKDTMVGVAAMLRALLSERDALTAQLAEARDSALEEAAGRIGAFLACARVGVNEYIKGQDEAAIYLRDEIRALKSQENK